MSGRRGWSSLLHRLRGGDPDSFNSELDTSSATGLTQYVTADPEMLKRLSPFSNLAGEELVFLASQVMTGRAEPGKLIIERGATDPWTYFLLEGALDLEAGDGRVTRISANDERALMPIAQLKPRQYRVRAATSVRFVRIDDELFDRYRSASGISGYEVEEHQAGNELSLAAEVWRAISAKQSGSGLEVPSPSRMTTRLDGLIRGAPPDPDTLVLALSQDPGIVATLIRHANASEFAQQRPVSDVPQAIERLGVERTLKLLRNVVTRNTFRAGAAVLNAHMMEWWRHSRAVAALCEVLSRRLDVLDPDCARVAGLVHDIGVPVLLNTLRTHPESAVGAGSVDDVVVDLRVRVGEMVLRSHHFPDFYLPVIRESDNWARETNRLADYADLVIVARLHALLAANRLPRMTPMHELPVAARIGLGAQGPRFSLDVIAEARNQIVEAKRRMQP
jgi:HD-like signal output (HDOD) protein